MAETQRHLPLNCWCKHPEDEHYERRDAYALDAAVLYGCHSCDAERKGPPAARG